MEGDELGPGAAGGVNCGVKCGEGTEMSQAAGGVNCGVECGEETEVKAGQRPAASGRTELRSEPAVFGFGNEILPEGARPHDTAAAPRARPTERKAASATRRAPDSRGQ